MNYGDCVVLEWREKMKKDDDIGSIGEDIKVKERHLTLGILISSLATSLVIVEYFNLGSNVLDGTIRVIGLTFAIGLLIELIITDWKGWIGYTLFLILLGLFAYEFPRLSYFLGLLYQYGIYILLTFAAIISAAVIFFNKE